MPQCPGKECGLCKGTGIVTPEAVQTIQGLLRFNQRCVCTVTDAELTTGLEFICRKFTKETKSESG